MKKIELGRTGIEISVLGLGTMYFGSRVDEQTSFRLLDVYQAHGGNFLDSANKYASWLPGRKGGESERLIGRWLKQKGRAADPVIATKVGFPYGELPRSLKREVIISECERSLRRLGVECIDVYFAHAYDPETPVEESMEAFFRLKKSGKIRAVGASNYPGWRLEEARAAADRLGWEGYCCLQQRHSYLEPSSRAEFGNQVFLTPEISNYCSLKDLTLMAYSPLLGGMYNKEAMKLPAWYDSRISQQRLLALRSLSRTSGFTPNQLVLAWMLHSIPPVVPLISGSKEVQVAENLKAASIDLGTEDMDLLNQTLIEPKP